MNNNEATFLPRWLAPRLRAVAREARITVLTGARQVGKSTLLAHELGSDWTFHSLDDLDVQAQVQRDPELLLTASKHLVLDEAHAVPAIFPLIKRLADQDRSRRFVLSGSANLLLLSRTTESLAGRAEFLHLLPLSQGELTTHQIPSWMEAALEGRLNLSGIGNFRLEAIDLANHVWRGGMPEVVYRRSAASIVRWRDGYIRSYLEKDLRELSQIDNLPDFKRLMSLAALRCGCLLNQSELARDAALSQPTAHRYMGLLEVSEQCCRLSPFHSNTSKSIIKTPKLMWTDTGIAAFCAGFHSSSDLVAGREWGSMLECYVFNQLRAICGTWDPPGEIFFWRTRSGIEVDFVIRHGRRLLACEVKAGARVRFEDTAGIQEFMRDNPECRMGLVLHGGTEIKVFSDRLAAVPIAMLSGDTSRT